MSITEYEDDDEQFVGSGRIKAIAILMIALGIFAITFPFFASITSALLFGWIFVFAGLAQSTYSFQSRGSGQVWKLILGLLYLISGIIVIANPFEGLVAFTLVIGITIVVQGMIQVAIAFRMRRVSPNWIWMLVSGLIGIIFGILVWSISSLSAAWLVGSLIGINLLFDGIWMLTLHTGQHRSLYYRN